MDHANSIIYRGPERDAKIVLLHHDSHFDVLTSLKAWFDKSYWCDRCDKGYEQRYNHVCMNKCRRCLRVNCSEGNAVFCPDCGLTFRNDDCFAEHKNEVGVKRAICKNIFKCGSCRRMISLFARAKDNPHVCGESLCKNCSRFEDPLSHKCFMKIKALKDKDAERHQNVSCLYFDLETFVGEDGVLVPNLAVSAPCDGL